MYNYHHICVGFIIQHMEIPHNILIIIIIIIIIIITLTEIRLFISP
jgi:hypothetical protein